MRQTSDLWAPPGRRLAPRIVGDVMAVNVDTFFLYFHALSVVYEHPGPTQVCRSISPPLRLRHPYYPWNPKFLEIGLVYSNEEHPSSIFPVVSFPSMKKIWRRRFFHSHKSPRVQQTFLRGSINVFVTCIFECGVVGH